ncbi:MAG: zinc-binding dehydrogenase [Flavobacteriales bacterium]
MRTLRADHVIDYKRSDFTQSADRYDVMLQHGGPHELHRLKHLLAPRGPVCDQRGRWSRTTGRC